MELLRSNLGDTYNSGGYSYTATENGLNSAVHAFTFYMGEPLRDSDGKIEIINPFTDGVLIDTSAKTKIMNAIDTKLTDLETVPSQWQKTTTPDAMTDIPEACINRDSCDKKAYYVKHISDTHEMNSLMGQTKVLVFQERANNTNSLKIKQTLTLLQTPINYNSKQQTTAQTRIHS